MTARTVRTAGLIALLLLNTLSGAAKVEGFRHRHAAEKAIASADLGRAFAALNASLAWQPDDAPTYVLIGRVIHLAESNGLPVRGLEDLTPGQRLGLGVRAVGRAIALNPADTWSWLGLADVYRASRSARIRRQRLLRAVESAAAGGKEHPDAGEAAAPGASPEDRLLFAAAGKAIDLEPDFYFYHDFLATLYMDEGLKTEAAEEIRTSFAMMPALESHALIEDEALVRGMADPILAGIEEASANPFVTPVMVARARARALEMIGRSQEAIEAYETLGRMGGEEHASECRLAIARLHQDQGRYRESIAILDRLIEADPDGGTGVSALYHRAMAYARLADHRRAADDLRRYLTRRAGSPALLLTYAEELAAAGDAAGAERTYLGVVKSDPEEAAAYRGLIALLMRQRRLAEAMGYAEALRRVDPDDRTADAIRRRIEEAGGPAPP